MLDMHSHILPGIDDGSKDMEMTLEMLRIAEEDGIRQIIATPHFYKFNYENSYTDVIKLINMVNVRAEEVGIDIDIMPGQEVYLDEFTLDLYKRGIIGTLNDSQYMLVELQPSKLEDYIHDIIYELRVEGIIPIIAHPERYSFVQDSLESLNGFIKEGCLFQLNAGCIAGSYGKRIKKTAERLLENGLCDFIASDAHSTGMRKPVIKKVLKDTLKTYRHMDTNVESNWRQLSKNEIIVRDRELFKENKSIFRLLKR